MKIGLINVDSSKKFPNLALMKIAAWHKQQGHHVETYQPLFGGIYDKIYMSKIFTFTKDYPYAINAKEIIKGGSGYDLHNKLPDEIENIYPDYSLFPSLTRSTAFGFLTRGCPRSCEFCIVSKKEGNCSVKVANLSQFWNGQKEVKLLDPNLLACDDWKDLLSQLIDSKAKIDFTQGLDIRLMDEEKAQYINKINVKMLHFAWDNFEFHTYDKLKEFKNISTLRGRDMRVYVLTNFNTHIDQDLERIYKLRELGYDPYVMIFEKEKLEKGHILKQVQRWVNAKPIWRSCDKFEDYKKVI